MGNKNIERLLGKKVLVLRVGGELGIKSRRTRYRMIENLLANIKQLLDGNIEYTILKYRSRIIIALKDEELLEESALLIAKATSGVSSLSIALIGSSNEEAILSEGKDFSISHIKNNSSFALRVKREGSHKFTSMDIARKLGATILQSNPTLKVNLENPEYEVYLDIRGMVVFYYTERILGIDGIPERSQGQSVAIIKPHSNSLLSAMLMKKRGVHLFPIYFDTGKETKEEYLDVIRKDINKDVVVIDISRFLDNYKRNKSLCMLCQVYCEEVAQELAEEKGIKTVISPTCFTCDDTKMTIAALQYLESQSRITILRPIQMEYYGSVEVFKLIDKSTCCPFRDYINYEMSEDFDEHLVDKVLMGYKEPKI
ncbi:MAG: THUMP domain-containing protein [Candidatus Hodarchaeales archaeon]